MKKYVSVVALMSMAITTLFAAPADAAKNKGPITGPFVWDNYLETTGRYEGLPSDTYTDPVVFGDQSSEGADDFVLTRTTTITEVDVNGFYSQNTDPSHAVSLDAGPADSATVRFYASTTVGGVPVPGALVGGPRTVAVDRWADFKLHIDPVQLPAGRYWVSVAADINYTLHGQWLWIDALPHAPRGNEAVWRQPGDAGGTGCSDWCRLRAAFPDHITVPDDLSFRVIGTLG